jgi:hypothetical protein
MTNGEIIEQLENTIGLIKQDGKDWLDDRDIPILEACIKALTSLDKIRAEIADMPKLYPFIDHVDTYVKVDDVLAIIDKYRGE